MASKPGSMRPHGAAGHSTLQRLLLLTSRHRSGGINRLLGYWMAFVAGAVNAGGFVVLQQYTSHMTGFLSQLADHIALGHTMLALSMLGVLLAFVCGAALTAVLVNRARQQHLRSIYALPLLLEAGLLLVFGLIGAAAQRWRTPLTVPLTVLWLAFTMGVQNATLTKMSHASIRTTHMTGVLTDLGIELGKMLFWNRVAAGDPHHVQANYAKVRLFAGLLGMFLGGGVLGALGFVHLGFVCVVPLALLLMAVSLPHLWADWRYGSLPHQSHPPGSLTDT